MALQIFGSTAGAGAGGGGGGGASATVVTSTPYAATVTPTVGTTGAAQILNVGTLTGNITLANPTGTPTDGQTIKVRTAQDATGGRTFTFGSAFQPSITVPYAAVPTLASSKFTLLFEWYATDSKWTLSGVVAR